MKTMKKALLELIMLVGLLSSLPAAAQIWGTGASCSGDVIGTTLTCYNLSLGGSTILVGLNASANICSTLNTPADWVKVGCASSTSAHSAAVFVHTSNYCSACTARGLPSGCCTGPVTGDCTENPVFTWTGTALVHAFNFRLEGAAQQSGGSPLDVSSTHTGTALTGPITASSVTTTSPVDKLVEWVFTDAAGLSSVFTPPADMPLMINDNVHVPSADSWHTNGYQTFITEKRQMYPTATGDKTGSVTVSTDYVAFLIALKNLHAPGPRIDSGIGFTFSVIGNYLKNPGDSGYCNDCKNSEDGATVGAQCASGGTGAKAVREGTTATAYNNCF